MKKLLLSMAAAALCAPAFAATGDVTTILDQTFAAGVELTNGSNYAWGSEIQGMIYDADDTKDTNDDNGLFLSNHSDKSQNFENRDFLTFRAVIGSATKELDFSYEVYCPRDKGQNNTYYTINYFNANDEFVFGVQEYSGGWAFGANIITANADGTTTTSPLPASHISKGGGTTVNYTVTFSGEQAIIAIDGGSYTAYTAKLGIKAIRLSVTGENGYDRDMYMKNYVIKSTEVEAAQFADYTLKYVVDGETVKEVKKSGVVGSEIALAAADTENFFNEDKTVKYIYVDNDAEGQTVNADGSTVVTLNYRLAEVFSYTVKNNVNEAAKEGSCLEGESVTVPYSRFIIDNEGVVWEKYPGRNTPYKYTFTPEANEYVETLEYAATEITDGIYFVEGEDIEGMVEVTRDNADARCSNAAGGYAAEPVEVYTLQPGTYKVTMGVWGNGGAEFALKLGEETVLTAASQGYWFDTTSEEFTVTEATTLVFEGSASNKPLDYVLITGTLEGSAVAGVEAAEAEGAWYNLQGVRVAAPTQSGLYIHNGKKVIVK